jgi:hypothetical protein
MGSSIGRTGIIRFFYKKICEKGAVRVGTILANCCCAICFDLGVLGAITSWHHLRFP